MNNLKNTDIKHLLNNCAELLKKNGIETFRLDAEVLLAHVLQKPREFILAHPEHKLSQKLATSYKLLIARRLKGEPMAYITGHKEFYGLDFIVNKDVLIPRPETELMVEKSSTLLRNMLRNMLRNNIFVVDVGTGSGCVIISVAKTIQDQNNAKISFWGIDNSKKAINIAKQNAQKHAASENIKFQNGRFLNPLLESEIINLKSKMVILANLPYLSENIYNAAPESVKKYEPKDALLSGHDGLDHYRKLLNQIKILINLHSISAMVMLEISPEQKTPVTKLIKSNFANVKIKFSRDLANKYRLVSFTI